MTEGQLFGCFVLLGAAAGGIYIGLEWFRRRVRHRRIWIYVEDGICVMVTGGVLYGMFLHWNRGVLRGYGFLGFLAGILLIKGISRCIRRIICEKIRKKPKNTR